MPHMPNREHRLESRNELSELSRPSLSLTAHSARLSLALGLDFVTDVMSDVNLLWTVY